MLVFFASINSKIEFVFYWSSQ